MDPIASLLSNVTIGELVLEEVQLAEIDNLVMGYSPHPFNEREAKYFFQYDHILERISEMLTDGYQQATRPWWPCLYSAAHNPEFVLAEGETDLVPGGKYTIEGTYYC
jgi:hypothetical protein